MTQEEKQLLFRELCARLPYGVKCSITKKGVVRELKPMNNGVSMPVNQVCDITLIKTLNTDIVNDFNNDNIVLKPYLRPMSSMTEEEERTLDSMCNGVEMVSRLSGLKMFDKAFDWLNAHHLDYRGLIDKGLALEAKEGMYKME